MPAVALGIILLLCSFLVFLYVGQESTRSVTIVLIVYLLIMMLMCYFEKFPEQAVTALFGCLFGTFFGHLYRSTIGNKKS